MTVPIVYCDYDESLWQAAARHGFVPPGYRVGLTAEDPLRDGEVRVAEVRASKYGRGVPVYQTNVEKGGGDGQGVSGADDER